MAELRLADALVDPHTAEQLAERTGTHAPTLGRLLRTLAALGLVTQQGGTFRLTAAGARLRSDVPGSDWGAMMMMTAPWTLATWHHLPEAVRTGKPVFEAVHGESFWSFLRSREDVSRIFDDAMARQSKGQEAAALIADALQQTGATKVVDVGGGKGHLIAQIVALSPSLHGLLADQPDQVERAAEVFAAHGVTDRCEAVACDFFQFVPDHGDAYILSNILHDWDDDHSVRILERIHESCAPGARVIVVESLLPDDLDEVNADSAQVRLLDLMMLLNFGARERSLTEYADLLEAAGFVDVQVAGGSGPHVVVARRSSPADAP